MDPFLTRPALTEQEEMVVRLCQEGKLTRKEIALQMEVSGTRIGQIYALAQTKLQDFKENGGDALSLLPSRARRVVVDCGIPSREQVRSAIRSGRMKWLQGMGGVIWEGRMVEKVSHKTWEAIHAWAGHPPLP